MSKGGTKVNETQQQRALADFAMNQLQDYKARWLPVQKQLASQIQQTGAAGSQARKEATGRSSTDTAIQFAQAEGALSKMLANKGVNPGSSRAKLAVTGLGEDKAKTTGMGAMIADQQIDDAYTKGLMALTNIGRGERAEVSSGLESQAQQSARDAAASAQASVAARAGDAQALGMAGGLGLQQALNRPAGPQVPGISPQALGTQADGFNPNAFAGP